MSRSARSHASSSSAPGTSSPGKQPTQQKRSQRSAADAPDAVLLDVQLPDRDGFSVATALTGAGGPAVVLISSREAEDYGRRIEACGARGFIPKSRLSAAAFAALVE